MRSKKIISTLAALSLAVSCFVGFASGVSAADTTLTFDITDAYTYDSWGGVASYTEGGVTYNMASPGRGTIAVVTNGEGSAIEYQLAANNGSRNGSLTLDSARNTDVEYSFDTNIADGSVLKLGGDNVSTTLVEVTDSFLVLYNQGGTLKYWDYTTSAFVGTGLSVSSVNVSGTVNFTAKTATVTLTPAEGEAVEIETSGFVATQFSAMGTSNAVSNGAMAVLLDNMCITGSYTTEAEPTVPTAPKPMTTGTEAEYTSYYGETTTALSGSTTQMLSENASIGDRLVLEYDAYVADGGKLSIQYGGNGLTGPALILDSTDTTTLANDQQVTWVKYNTGADYGINTSDPYSFYQKGKWAHVTAICDIVGGTANNPTTLRIKPITVNVEPSNGEEWTTNLGGNGKPREPYSNREIAGRNLAPGFSNNTNRNFDRFNITATGEVYIANMVTYSLPTITAATTTAAVDGTALPAFDETTTFYNTDGTEAAPDVTGKEVTTVYAKITNATEGVKPTITVDDGTEKIESTTWEPVPGTNIYFAQFVGTFEDFGTIIVSYPNATTVTVLEPAAEETE